MFGDRAGEDDALGNLGTAFDQHNKAIEFYKHLHISHELGDGDGEGAALGNLGAAFYIQPWPA